MAPPTRPTAMGSSIVPTRSWFLSFSHLVNGRYCPVILAYECAPASIARKSLPVAITTGSIPFIIPLLWVAHLYGSDFASRYALMTASTTSSPPMSSFAKTARANANLCVARLEMIRRFTLPAVSCSINGATASAIVFTAFAPIASLTLTKRWTITMGPASVSMTSTSRSFAPPPRLTSTGSFSFALSKISCLCVRMVNFADAGSETPVTCICPIIIGSVEPA